ncbi:uncharacterized protein LOC116772652 [Danaus plexippus]|uniref:uncharacterized protein LOC116772652 n=1 Tax=Danaus plexippus TaxID=13037 RepID=UPI002AB1A7D3|nr:uncharacterized protein LOC116772652 [Danaus plexippus]
MEHFVILSLLAVVLAFDTDRRCLLHAGRCVSHCPRNMFPYHTKCDGQTISQRTCDKPNVYVLGYSCGWSRCDCGGDLVLDEHTNICMKLFDCPTHPTKLPRLNSVTERRRRGQNRYRVSKRIKIPKEDINELP